ncbi:hypothetical protein [Cryobacterium tepidiphilum]|uniref:Uncharacterized protein n=1 Tax=Cryobacterium tepidiphilum TaxID=2486026 RepID=A0A3M8LPE4_9MICO|nr:hypothetical protein [Cryobacterium tepidiphilum]RNE67353.1 hypothetical protein EEJ31_00835 [Cryobacterium tepidiphilum]
MNTRFSRHDEHVVDTVLSEAGGTQSDGLRNALLELRGFAHAPALSSELHARETAPAIDLGRARRARRRVGLTSLAVVAAMGLGVGAAAAASPDFRDSAQETVAGLISSLAAAPSAPAETELPEPTAAPTAPPVAPAAPPAPEHVRSATPDAPHSDAGTAAKPGRSEEALRRQGPTLPKLPEQASRATPAARVPDHAAPSAGIPRSPHVPASPGTAHKTKQDEVASVGTAHETAEDEDDSAGKGRGSR